MKIGREWENVSEFLFRKERPCGQGRYSRASQIMFSHM